MMIPGRRWLLVAALLLIAIAGLRGYVTDDTWIHLRYARNLIDLGEFSFNPGEATYGATSPLWIFGLVLLLKLGVAPLVAAKVLGLASAVLMLVIASWMIDRILKRMGLQPAWWSFLMAILILDAWFQRWTLSGMETPLACALLLAMLMPACSAKPNWLAFGAAAGLAALVRPEFALFGPLALPWLLIFHSDPGPRLKAFAAAALGWAALLGPWLWYAWTAFARLTPETAAAKSYGITFDPTSLAANLFRSLTQLLTVQVFLWVGVLAALLIWRHAVRSTRKLAAASDSEAIRRLTEREAPPQGLKAMTGILATWTVLLLGGYALKQVWVISRYVSPLLPVFVLVLGGWSAWMTFDREIALGKRWYVTKKMGSIVSVLLVCGILYFASNAILLSAKIRPHTIQLSHGVEACFFGMGEWLRDNTPQDTVVAAHDIGPLGYASGRRILDLAGLVSPEVLELGREMGFERMVASGAWLEAEVPDYVYDRTNGPPRWDGVVMHGVHFEHVASCDVEGVGLREPETMVYTLYRLTPVESTAGD